MRPLLYIGTYHKGAKESSEKMFGFKSFTKRHKTLGQELWGQM